LSIKNRSCTCPRKAACARCSAARICFAVDGFGQRLRAGARPLAGDVAVARAARSRRALSPGWCAGSQSL
jgi:hypothetical protein